MKMKKASLLMLFMFGLFFMPRGMVSATDIHSPELFYTIGYEQGPRPSAGIDDFDATDEYVFFLYNNLSCTIDAYTLNGDYAFSLLFSDQRNGAMLLRCVDNLLYGTNKYGSVFVFDGDQLINRYTSKEARQQEFFKSLPTSGKNNVKLRWFSLVKLDENGVEQQKIPLPLDMILRIYGGYSRYIMFAALFAIFLIQQKKKSKIPTYERYDVLNDRRP